MSKRVGGTRSGGGKGGPPATASLVWTRQGFEREATHAFDVARVKFAGRTQKFEDDVEIVLLKVEKGLGAFAGERPPDLPRHAGGKRRGFDKHAPAVDVVAMALGVTSLFEAVDQRGDGARREARRFREFARSHRPSKRNQREAVEVIGVDAQEARRSLIEGVRIVLELGRLHANEFGEG